MRPFSLASIPRATRITTRINPFFTQPRNFSFTQATMGVGQKVTMEYTGWLQENGTKGKQFDSSVGRGDFVVPIGVGQVIKGWDEGVTQMKLGEKATLLITPDYGYGPRGFPGAIPPNSTLIFDVELKKIG
ncbi:FK506-binding protein 1 [Fusarium culmorum]|uniref:peptidylprolyl isomerase n=1 Tax=Fusarium culmorum TaxID=5516 RepID=A0A2T4GCJ8_FUSCU|nr:FK506-binding protein 1 [Fusarium culmorum]